MSQNGFTPKQQLFVKNYLIFKNASKAARLAGYSAKTARSAGSRLLTNVDISKVIEKGLAQQLKEAEVTAENILFRLRQIAFADNDSGNLRALELFGKALGLFQNRPGEHKKEQSIGSLIGVGQNGVLRSSK